MRSKTISTLGARTVRLFLVAMILAVAVPSTPARPASAQSVSGCLGWTSGGTTYTTRRIQYTSDGILHLVGCGEVFTLTQILAALQSNAISGAEPADALQLVDPAAKTWMLNVKLSVEEGATLNLIGGSGGDVDWLRLKSGTAGIIFLRTVNGEISMRSTRVTSWDPTTGTFDFTDPGSPGTNEVPGGGAKPRSFVSARSFLAAGRAWSPPTACDVNGGGRDAYEARMDVIDSSVEYLGYNGAEAYGMSWKVNTNDASLLPPNSRELYNRADVFGTISNSTFSQNYFGNYMFGAYCMDISGSTYADNYYYGLDPHDDSDYLDIIGNTFVRNGGHGLICSVYCNNIVIVNNQALDNSKHGIMLHRRVDGAIVEGNTSRGNGDTGLAIFDSYDAVVRNNVIESNGIAGVRLSVGASRNLIENNTITGAPAASAGNGYALFSFSGSDLPTVGSNRRLSDNVFRGNRITGFKSPAVKLSDASGTLIEGNTISVAPGLTTYEFRDGQGNIVQRNTVPGKTTVRTVQSATSQPVGTTVLRDPQLGREVAVQHTPSGGGTTTVEDSRSYVWSGADATAAVGGTRAVLTGAGATITPRDLIVRPAANDVIVSVSSWATAAPYAKAWTERTSTDAGRVAHTVGDLLAGACYAVSVDGASIGSYLASGAGSAGRITFDYTGGYSGGTPRQFTVAASQASPCGTAATATATATRTPTPTAVSTATSTPTPTPTSPAVATATATTAPLPTATTAPAAVAFADGFETGDLRAWTIASGIAVQGQDVYAGSFAARATTAGSPAYAQRTLSTPQGDVYYRVRFKIATKSTIGYLLRVRTAAGGDIVGLNVSSSGKLSVYNRATALTTTSSTTVTSGVWHEVQLHVNQVSGLVEVWYDGARVDTLSKPQSVGTAPIGRVELGDQATGRSFDMVFDDVQLDTSYIPTSFVPAPPATATATPRPTSTAVPPTAVPTSTPVPATATPAPAATATAFPPTATAAPAATATPTVIPTETPVPTGTPTPIPAGSPPPVG